MTTVTIACPMSAPEGWTCDGELRESEALMHDDCRHCGLYAFVCARCGLCEDCHDHPMEKERSLPS